MTKMPILKSSTRSLVLLNALSVSLIIVIIELLLHHFLPYSVTTIGHLYSRNASLYGWGYHPRELVRIHDPDTGQVHKSLTNNHGWRDKDRQFKNPRNSFRILVVGDSNTFGAIVPAEKIYTRVLEKILQEEGFNVEVISIAYGRWGTDQEVEALRVEGLRYDPDLVILQFCTNDLDDNTRFSRDGIIIEKPFTFVLDESDNLVRTENPNWKELEDTWKSRIRLVISRSEILKRIHGLQINSRIGGTRILRSFEVRSPEPEADVLASYSINASKIAQFRAVLPGLDAGFLNFAAERMDKHIHSVDMVRAVEEYGLREHRDIILRFFEERWFKSWTPSMFRPGPPDTCSFSWKLLFALVREAKHLADSIDTDLAIISDNEVGFYNWERYWFRIAEGEIWRANYLAPSAILRDFARENGIGFVENRRGYQRARNDPHPNIDGNLAMASDLRDYVLTHYREEITSR